MVTNAMRYLQRCEGVRRDVLLLDETMMTYKVLPSMMSLPRHTQTHDAYTHAHTL
jgi:hypothetical protein